MIYDREKWRKTLRWLFWLYALLMLWLLYIRNRPGFLEMGDAYWAQVKSNYNLIPFHTISNFWHILTHREYYMEKWGFASMYYFQARNAIVNLAGNVVMFIPLGFFLPALGKKLRRLWKTAGCAALTVMLIEVTQLLTLMGRCDVDDLILNLIGVAIGYGVFRLGATVTKK